MSPGERDPSTASALLAVDTGGTFTDLLLWKEGSLTVLKVPSTPADPAMAVLEGITRLLGTDATFVLLHGSTVATNALLERKGARVALITNAGFEDVLAIGRQNRPQLYALVGHRKPPLVPAGRRLGIRGRLGPDGEEIDPLDPGELESLPTRLREAGSEAVAVCLLHSYANPSHEEAVLAALADLDMPVSVSSRLIPEYREYERTSTTVVNAFVAPVMDRYLGRLAAEAGAERVAVMGSNGGALAVARARSEPVHTVLSGPAGGVVGAMTWARRAGAEGIVTFDMGGTSTDVSLCPGRPLHTREFEIDGHPVAVPVLDIHTVGAGGGSIARVDPGGALRVGPESAGADPGPIAYRRGGTEVTVTDAHVWLGRIPTDAFLGGAEELDRASIEGPLRALADQLGSGLDEAAEGVLSVVDTAMERALRVISVERGHDPAGLALVAFGGAGALHAAELAGRLGAERAIIPPDPGLLSAWGILTAPVTREASRTVLTGEGDASSHARLEGVFHELETSAVEGLIDDGADPAAVTVTRRIDARYRGQSFELSVDAEGWVEAFHALHERRYGTRRDDSIVEAVTLRVTASVPGPDVPPPELPQSVGPPPSTPSTVVHGGRKLESPRIWRRDLRAGHEIDGPTLVLDYSATTWLPPGWRIEVDGTGVLHMRRA